MKRKTLRICYLVLECLLESLKMPLTHVGGIFRT